MGGSPCELVFVRILILFNQFEFQFAQAFFDFLNFKTKYHLPRAQFQIFYVSAQFFDSCFDLIKLLINLIKTVIYTIESFLYY